MSRKLTERGFSSVTQDFFWNEMHSGNLGTKVSVITQKVQNQFILRGFNASTWWLVDWGKGFKLCEMEIKVMAAAGINQACRV